MAQTPQVEFHFVNSSIHSPIVPQDKAVRTLIRKQAMKKASAARRRDGTYGKHNLRQLPVFIVNKDTTEAWAQEKRAATDNNNCFVHVEEVDTKPKIIPEVKPKDEPRTATSSAVIKSESKILLDRHRYARRLALTEVPPNLSAKGYELASINSDFDLLNLSTLATIHVGRAARSALSQDPFGLVNQLRSQKRWSYLDFLPSRFENNACLRDATRCVTARARLILQPGRAGEAAVITHYVKALDSLQKALDCPKQRYQPEILCATEILAIYELLDPSGESAWIRHSAGAARLIQLRGPTNYKSDFEKALFIAQTFPITTECLLNGTRCFLESKPWQETMDSVIADHTGITDRSEIVVTLLRYKSYIPGHVVDICSIIFADTPQAQEFIDSVIYRLRKLCIDLKYWYVRYEAIIASLPDMNIGEANHDSHCKVYANYISCLMIASRLLASISPSDRREGEAVALQLAESMLDLRNQMKFSSTCLFMAQTIIGAQATWDTREKWRVQGDDEPGATYTDTRGYIDGVTLGEWAAGLKKMDKV